MNDKVTSLLLRIHQLEEELEVELSAARGRFHYYVEKGRVYFEEGIAKEHRRLRRSVAALLRATEWRDIPAGLATLAMAVPLLLLDLFLGLYQFIAFNLYGIDKVRRSDFVIVDRHHLAYLNWIEKFNCLYCGYANGLLAYAKVVAGRTEQYWCPIKHAQRVHAPHTRYGRFLEYGDAESYHQGVSRLRADLRKRRETGDGAKPTGS